MASLVKNKGKVGMPSFYSEASTSVKSKAEGVKSKLPLFALLILAGVAIIFVLRNRSSDSSTQTGAALTVIPTAEGDIGNIINMTNAINALSGQVHTPSPVPSGGTSTPITTTPNPANTPTAPSLVQNLNVQGTDEYAAMIRSGGPDLIAQGSVGPITRIAGTSDAAWEQTKSVNMSLEQWFAYQRAKGTPQSTYFGPTAGPEQRALEEAAKKAIGQT